MLICLAWECNNSSWRLEVNLKWSFELGQLSGDTRVVTQWKVFFLGVSCELWVCSVCWVCILRAVAWTGLIDLWLVLIELGSESDMDKCWVTWNMVSVWCSRLEWRLLLVVIIMGRPMTNRNNERTFTWANRLPYWTSIWHGSFKTQKVKTCSNPFRPNDYLL